MRKVFGYITVVAICLYVLNILTLAIFGKTSLIEKVIQDTHTSYRQYQWTEDVNLASDLNLSRNQIDLLHEFYSDTKADFKYLNINGFEEVQDIFSAEDKYLHLIMADKHFVFPVYKVEESEKMNEYYHGYRRIYLWLFIEWVKIDEEFLGIS